MEGKQRRKNPTFGWPLLALFSLPLVSLSQRRSASRLPAPRRSSSRTLPEINTTGDYSLCHSSASPRAALPLVSPRRAALPLDLLVHQRGLLSPPRFWTQ
ncbi:unnamed protein product [Linum trigynum]|uniref:Secreted protein n=1 Tax=Linum trigynum TaxID=586398 RepID=A0AAV2EM77_9ROSI